MIFLCGQSEQRLERGHGSLTPVKTKHEFIEIILQVFGINAMMSSVEPRLEVTQSPVNVKGLGFGMMEIVSIACQGRRRVPLPLIGGDFTARFHVFLQKATDGGRIGTLGHGQAQPSGFFHIAAMLVGIGDHLHRAKDQRAVLRRRYAPTSFTSDRASDDDLVGFDSPLQASAGLIHHGPAQAM